MKKLNLVMIMALGMTVAFTSCKKESSQAGETVTQRTNKVPQRFAVDIPESIASTKAGSRSTSDTLKGNDIYEHLGTFIDVGEGAAEVVEDIMQGISRHNIDRAMTHTFEGDDGRSKYLVVEESASYNGKSYELKATISDELSMGNADGGKALQVFWNTNPIEGVAILKPKNLEVGSDQDENAVFRVEYSEKGDLGYEAHMIVELADLEMPSPLEEPYAVNNLKMFVGKSGDHIDVFGNSNHPNATFITADKVGFNWAFAASALESKDIAVAEVGLPASTLDASTRQVILTDNGIQKVFEDQIHATWPGIDSSEVAGYLSEMGAPGYFDEYGFVQAESSPGTEYDASAQRILSLTPYNPKDINGLSIDFQ